MEQPRQIKSANDFSYRLKLWREGRGLTIDMQKAGLLRNLFEELGELAAAIKNNDENEYIDALADILVFVFNTIEYDPKANFDVRDILVGDFEYSRMSELLSLISRYVEELEYQDNFPAINDIRIIASCLFRLVLSMMREKEYDIYFVLEETMKAIDSRKGKWDEELKKFVKDTTQPKYDPNYLPLKGVLYCRPATPINNQE